MKFYNIVQRSRHGRNSQECHSQNLRHLPLWGNAMWWCFTVSKHCTGCLGESACCLLYFACETLSLVYRTYTRHSGTILKCRKTHKIQHFWGLFKDTEVGEVLLNSLWLRPLSCKTSICGPPPLCPECAELFHQILSTGVGWREHNPAEESVVRILV